MESNGTTVTSEPKLDMYKAVTDPPQWLTKAYIEKALKDSEKDPSLKLSDYRIVAATKPGDNFASVALRLRASYHTKGKDISKSFIIKVEHYEEGFKKEAMADAVLFETEIAMYTKTIPEMQRLIREVDADEIIAPPISYSNLKPYKIVFIDDISPEFIMSEKPLDFEESLLVFEKIASFHALSFFMGEDHEPMQQYTSGFISSHLEKTSSFLVQTMMAVGRVIAQWSDQMKVAGEKLQALEPTIFKKLMKLFVKNDLTGYNVLNHGDFHIKNILFRDQANYGKAVDKTRLIDFQLCIWATPAIDLIFALYGMVGNEARERREELIRHYHEHFTRTLQKLGYLKNAPTLQDLQVELLRNGLIEVFMVTFFLPMLYTPKSETANVGEVSHEQMDAMRKAVLEQPILKDTLMKLFPVFLNKGFLE